MPPKIPIKKAFARHVERLGDRLVDVEHFRFDCTAKSRKRLMTFCNHCPRIWPSYRAPTLCPICKDTCAQAYVDKYFPGQVFIDHFAAVVCRNGASNEVFLASALCCYLDQYNRKLGHAISVGRALKQALRWPRNGMQIESSLAGVALRDRCRQLVEIEFHVTLPKMRSSNGSAGNKADSGTRVAAQEVPEVRAPDEHERESDYKETG